MIPDQMNAHRNNAPDQAERIKRQSLDHRPELLAPAGDFESLRAAIRNGADAVYLGAGSFNARQKAANFGDGQLQEAIDEAHRHALRVYLTLNTLVTDQELPAAVRVAEEAYSAGVDGIILQDVGLIRTIHQKLPDLPLFASTQMTIGDEAGLRAAARLGLKRVILARELSLSEITRLCAFAKELGLEIEVFVHGALCISISGQCLMSSLNGGRSGNRGACAQPCRLPWRLGRITGPDHQENNQPGASAASSSSGSTSGSTNGSSNGPAAVAEPWLSPRDQGLFAHLDELRQAGVTSLKIEGRMRNSTYVGQVVSVYRELLDQLDPSVKSAPPSQSNLSVKTDISVQTDISSQTDKQLPISAARRRLLLAFNRGGGFNDRYLTGRMEREFLSGKTSGSHGVLLGKIIRLNARSGEMTIQLDAKWPIDALPGRGDVLSIRRPQASDETASAPIGAIRSEIGAIRSEIGATRSEIGAIRSETGAIRSEFAPFRGEFAPFRGEIGQVVVRGFHPDVFEKLHENDPVYCMTDHEAERRAEKADLGRTAITLDIKPTGSGTIQLTATVMNGPQAGMQHRLDRPVEPIGSIAPERLDQQLRKTGQTVFRVVATLQAGEIPLSIGSLNDLRRQLLEQLTDKIVLACRRTLPAQLITSADPIDLADPVDPTNPTDLVDPVNRVASLHIQPAPLQIHPAASTLPALSAYYYRLPANLADILCGADEYILPLISLTPAMAPGLVQLIRQAEPDSRILAWLPPFNSGRLIDTLPGLIQSLPEWGFDGILAIQAGPDLGVSANEFTWQIDSGANITNSASLRHWLELGASAVALSHELNGEQARSLLNQSTINGNLARPLYGHLRVMTNVYCPVGHNLPGCRRCHTRVPDDQHPDPGSQYSLEDRRQLTFPLLTHPRDCHVEIMQHSILCVPQHILDLQQNMHQVTGLTARLYFLNETIQDRRQLIQQARSLLAAVGQSEQKQIQAIVAFTDTAAEIARRTGSKLHQDLPISLLPSSMMPTGLI